MTIWDGEGKSHCAYWSDEENNVHRTEMIKSYVARDRGGSRIDDLHSTDLSRLCVLGSFQIQQCSNAGSILKGILWSTGS